MGARFSTPVENDSEVHPVSYTMGTGSLPGVKRPGCGVDHLPPSSAEVKERIQLHVYSGACGGVVRKALRYKPAGRGFDSRWCHWNFSVT